MENICIKKIRINNSKYFSIKGSVNLSTKCLEFNMSFEKFKEIFKIDIHEVAFNPELMPQYSIVNIIDNNNNKYSFFDCIFGFSISNQLIKLYSKKLNYFYIGKISKSKDISVNEIYFETKVENKGHLIASINKIEFDYLKNIIVSINPYVHNNDIFINIFCKSKRAIKYSILSDYNFLVLEMIFLFWGIMPNILKIKLNKGNSNFCLVQQTADKYICKKTDYNGEILNEINSKIINEKALKKFHLFRKKSKILFDMLMIIMNDTGYIEIKNSMIIQLLEGLYKTIGPNKKDIKLREILEYYYIDNKKTNLILDSIDKANNNVFITKAVNHRNYLSHLNVLKNRNVFVELENNYAFWKLSICARIFILQSLLIEIDEKKLNDLLVRIKNWSIKNNINLK